jgi:hypothetical protein|tara:strand:- start:930 stop:1049 length:120 start_codon:yes stop_codon:yes gene_type:complete
MVRRKRRAGEQTARFAGSIADLIKTRKIPKRRRVKDFRR